jgi:type VI protein secretion system component Hcp
MQKRTPEWMVSFSTVSEVMLAGTAAMYLGLGSRIVTMFFDKIGAYSSVNKMSGFTELFGWNAEMHRYVSGDVTESLMSCASIYHSPLVLVIPSGSFAATAEEAMYRGTLIDAITIVRLGYVGGIFHILQTIVFSKCRIIRFQQQLDRLILHCNILQKLTMMTVFGQDGSIAGFAVGEVDLRKNDHLRLSLG